MAPTLSKSAVNYRMSQGGHHMCRDCTMFRKPHDCTLVKGHISPDGTCRRFYAKTGDHNAMDRS